MADLPSPYSGVVSRLHFKPGERIPVGSILVSFDEAGAAGGRAGAIAGESSQCPSSLRGLSRLQQRPPRPHLGKPHHLRRPNVGRDRSLPLQRHGDGLGNWALSSPPCRAAAPVDASRTRMSNATPTTANRPLQPPRPRYQKSKLLRQSQQLRSNLQRLHVWPPNVRPCRISRSGGRSSACPSQRRGGKSPAKWCSRYITAPHAAALDEADITELEALRQRSQERLQDRHTHLTLLPFMMKATVAALKRFPALNASLDEARKSSSSNAITISASPWIPNAA